MKYLLSLALLLLQASLPVAADSLTKEALLSKYRNAVELIDGYRGNSAELEAAHAELSAVLDANPGYAPAHREMARYLILRGYIRGRTFRPGSLEAADAYISRALEIDPGFAEAFVLRGHLYYLMGRHQDAVAALTKAEQLGTSDPWLQNNWASLLIDERKYEEAARRYRAVIDSKTPNKKAIAAAFEGLTDYYKAQRRFDEADEIYRKQIEFEPTTAWTYGNYAKFLLCLRGDHDRSIVQAREALQIMDYGVARYWLASGLYKKWAKEVIGGTPEKGGPYYAEAQKIYPDVYRIASNTRECPPLAEVRTALDLLKRKVDQGATIRQSP
jgi:Tfp pilus assembly protein PilF